MREIENTTYLRIGLGSRIYTTRGTRSGKRFRSINQGVAEWRTGRLQDNPRSAIQRVALAIHYLNIDSDIPGV